jgi:apolipoprotein N-acyltransferase
MQRVIAADLPRNTNRLARALSQLRSEAPTVTEWIATLSSTLLLILAFPDFDLSILAWVALAPLLIAVARRPNPWRAFVLGWTLGTLFFGATCYWITYSMIHYGGLPVVVAYALLIPGAVVIGLFPALFAFLIAIAIQRWGHNAILLAPIFWATYEWFRLGVTGQLWNAIGYSQAQLFGGLLIHPARWGGVYLVGFLIIAVNAALALAILRRNLIAMAISLSTIAGCLAVTFLAFVDNDRHQVSGLPTTLHVVAIQPNVPMTLVKTVEETKELLARHFTMSVQALNELSPDDVPRLVVWPESPMNFTYASDQSFRDLVANFTRANHTSLLFNSLEPAPNGGSYNSALLINEEGRLIAQYDKIRLLAFGEYVPLPQWLGGSLISGLVGDFTPGDKYTLMPIGANRAGTFICIESAYPWIARRLTDEGANVLINISNDGYLGPTAVMRQHLANAVFRATENGRPLLRVTNTGLSASIRSNGFVDEMTDGYVPTYRLWDVHASVARKTFYTKHGDVFVEVCSALTILIFIAAVFSRRRIID